MQLNAFVETTPIATIIFFDYFDCANVGQVRDPSVDAGNTTVRGAVDSLPGPVVIAVIVAVAEGCKLNPAHIGVIWSFRKTVLEELTTARYISIDLLETARASERLWESQRAPRTVRTGSKNGLLFSLSERFQCTRDRFSVVLKLSGCWRVSWLSALNARQSESTRDRLFCPLHYYCSSDAI